MLGLGACVIEAIAFLMLPHVGLIGGHVCAGVIGGMVILALVGGLVLPGLYEDRLHISDVPTAAGLLLTIGAVGGMLVPSIFGLVVERWGFDNGWRFCGVITLLTLGLRLFARSPTGERVKVGAVLADPRP